MHIIFDLDGTLVDSAPLCAQIINEMLVERSSAKVVAASDAQDYLTKGGAQLVTALLGSNPDQLASDLAGFRARYAARRTPADCLFAGVGDGVATLSRLGVRMAICSNKPQSLCDKIVSDLALAPYFAVVVGSVASVPLKPAPDLALAALAELGAAPRDCLFVGDSEVDRQTANGVGIPFVFVTYGYAEPDFVFDGLAQFDHFDELVQFASGQPDRSPARQRVA